MKILYVIVHHDDAKNISYVLNRNGYRVTRFNSSIGLFKKMAIADTLAQSILYLTTPHLPVWQRLANLVAYGGKFREIRDAHLTFHIGDACSWRSQEYSDYFEENWSEYLSLFGQIEAERGEFDPLLRSYLLHTGSRRLFPDLAR